MAMADHKISIIVTFGVLFMVATVLFSNQMMDEEIEYAKEKVEKTHTENIVKAQSGQKYPEIMFPKIEVVESEAQEAHQAKDMAPKQAKISSKPKIIYELALDEPLLIQ